MTGGVGNHTATPARARAIIAFAALAAGFILAREVAVIPTVVWFGLACLACALAGVSRGRLAAAALASAVLCLGAGWYAFRIGDVVARDAAWAEHLGGESVEMPMRVRGLVLNDPEFAVPSLAFIDPGARFTLRIGQIEGVPPTCGRLLVLCPARGARDLRAGDRVEVTGRLRAIEAPLNPGERDARLWAAQDGVRGVVRVPSTDLVTALPPRHGAMNRIESWWFRARAEGKRRAHEALLGAVPDDARSARGRAMLAALVLGAREHEANDVHSAYTRVGLAHVMAISGFHLAVMAAAAMMLVRLTGDRGALEPILVGSLVLLYLLIVPSNAPILRAGAMVLVLLAADAFGRRYDRIALLAWIAIAILIARPMDLWSIGFQLSFGLVGVLMWLGPRTFDAVTGERIITDIPKPRPWWDAPITWIKALLITSILCWVSAMPIVAYHTGHVSPFAVISTVIVLPLTIVLMWTAYAGVLLAVVSPASAEAVGPWLGIIGEATVSIVDGIDAIPWASLWIPKVSLAWTVAATAAGLLWAYRGRILDRAGLSAVAVVLAWFAVEMVLGTRLPARVMLRIDALAVGNGTTMIVRSGDEAVFWDCGSDRPGVGRRLIPRAAREIGAWRIASAFVTHPNEDHFEGLPDAASWLGVRTLRVGQAALDAAQARPDSSVGHFIKTMRDRGTHIDRVERGDAFPIGWRATLHLLAPPPDAEWKHINDHSLVALIEVATQAGTRRVLLTGDIQAHATRWLIDAGVPRVDVLEIPHHGSPIDSSLELLLRVDPHVVVQSGGRSRVGEVRWVGQREQRAWIMTAEHGAGWIEIRADGSIWIGAHRHPSPVRVLQGLR